MTRWIAALAVLFLFQSGPPALAGKPGIKLTVDPAGTYLATDPDDAAAAPTRLRLRRLGLGAGDYIGLRRVGAYDKDGRGRRFRDCCSRAMLGVFAKGSKLLKPGRYGQEAAKRSRVSDLPQDFGLSAKKATIVRIPKRANGLLFSANDDVFADNTDPDGNYGVKYTLPNAAPAVAAGRVLSAPVAGAVRVEGEALAAVSALPSLGEVPVLARSAAGRAAGSLGISSKTPMPTPQYRGWYPRSSCSGGVACWDVSASRWLGRGGGHTGIDLFAPKGSALRVPVDSRLTVFTSESFGLTAAFSFTVEDTATVYHIIYAHLDETVLTSGETYRAGTVVGFAGCTGNAKKGCGKELSQQGGRSDHVHVELIEKPELVNPLNPFRRDPVTLLGWEVAAPD